jgi:serine phosphatase RsbU (regulator of sigma subunit)
MTPQRIDIGVAQLARSGEVHSGDRHVVRTVAARTLIGVIDGVGHGLGAAQAAAAAASVLETYEGASVAKLLESCHERLRDTRGAAVTLIVVDTAARVLEWVGVGNVAAALVRIEPSGTHSVRELLIRAGLAGSSLQSTEALHVSIAAGDTIVLATDGVDPACMDEINPSEPVQQLAEHTLNRYGRAQDDALVVVARFRGGRG